MSAGAAAPTAVLPFTGFHTLWLIVAAFTLIAAGMAALRLARG